MADYIAIDGGTTNTRICLVRDRQVVDTLRLHVGAKNGIVDKSLLTEGLKQGIGELLGKHALQEKDMKRILASGMITSEFGLVNLPHIPAPAGLTELHERMYETVLTHIASVPFVFIRGVKMDSTAWEDADMMRGEETELMGLADSEAGVYILPGSHSKIIETDSRGRIARFKTMLTGEMISALSENTILKDAVDLREQTLQEEYLLKGFDYARQHGLNEALFKVRILKNLYGAGDSALYSFYMGCVLCDEIRYIQKRNAPRIILGGKTAIKNAMAVLLREYTQVPITVIPARLAEHASALGAVKIFEGQ